MDLAQIQSKDTFRVNERCLAFHGPLLYDAKILKVYKNAAPDGNHLYQIHFIGWHKRWDMQVDASMLNKITHDNRAYQDEFPDL